MGKYGVICISQFKSGVNRSFHRFLFPSATNEEEKFKRELLKFNITKQCKIILTDIKFQDSAIINRALRRKYTCYVCISKFSTLTDLNNHRNLHNQVESDDDIFTEELDESNNFKQSDNNSYNVTRDKLIVGKSIRIEHKSTKNADIIIMNSNTTDKLPIDSNINAACTSLSTDNIIVETNEGLGEVSCELCYDLFTSREELNHHMEFHRQLEKDLNLVVKENDVITAFRQNKISTNTSRIHTDVNSNNFEQNKNAISINVQNPLKNYFVNIAPYMQHNATNTHTNTSLPNLTDSDNNLSTTVLEIPSNINPVTGSIADSNTYYLIPFNNETVTHVGSNLQNSFPRTSKTTSSNNLLEKITSLAEDSEFLEQVDFCDINNFSEIEETALTGTLPSHINDNPFPIIDKVFYSPAKSTSKKSITQFRTMASNSVPLSPVTSEDDLRKTEQRSLLQSSLEGPKLSQLKLKVDNQNQNSIVNSQYTTVCKQLKRPFILANKNMCLKLKTVDSTLIKTSAPQPAATVNTVPTSDYLMSHNINFNSAVASKVLTPNIIKGRKYFVPKNTLNESVINVDSVIDKVLKDHRYTKPLTSKNVIKELVNTDITNSAVSSKLNKNKILFKCVPKNILLKKFMMSPAVLKTKPVYFSLTNTASTKDDKPKSSLCTDKIASKQIVKQGVNTKLASVINLTSTEDPILSLSDNSKSKASKSLEQCDSYGQDPLPVITNVMSLNSKNTTDQAKKIPTRCKIINKSPINNLDNFSSLDDIESALPATMIMRD